MSNLDLAIALEKERVEQQKRKAVTDKYVKMGEGAESLSEQPSLFDIDPMSISEGGVDVGTQAAKTATVRNVAQGVTLGFSDEIEALLTGQPVEQIRDEMEQYAGFRPSEAMVAEIIGAGMSPAQFARMPAFLANKSKYIQAAAAGGTGGFVYGFGTGEGGLVNRLQEGATVGFIGSMLSPLSIKLFDVVSKPINAVINRNKNRNSVESLKLVRDEMYDQVDDTFAIGLNDWQKGLVQASKIAEDSFYVPIPNESTSVDKFRSIVRNLSKQGMTLKQWDKMRQRLFKIAEKDEAWGDVTKRMIFEMDGIVDEGLAAGSTPALKAAREAHKAYAKAKLVEDTFNNIGDVSDRAGAFRNASRKLLNNKQVQRYFTDQEKQVLAEFAKGNFGDKALRLIGKMSPSYSGLSILMNMSAIAYNPALITYNIGTTGSKLISDATTVARARQIIRDIGGTENLLKLADMVDETDVMINGYTADRVERELFGEEQE